MKVQNSPDINLIADMMERSEIDFQEETDYSFDYITLSTNVRFIFNKDGSLLGVDNNV